MKKLLMVALMTLLMVMSVNACRLSVESAGTATYVGASPIGSSREGGDGNYVPYETTLTEKGTPGCYNPLIKRSITAVGFDGEKPMVNPAFTECVDLYSSELQNQGRDFESADKYWDSFVMKERADGFNPEVATYHYQLEQALNRA